jgi:phosphoribosyl-dephospho-CoA transferase
MSATCASPPGGPIAATDRPVPYDWATLSPDWPRALVAPLSPAAHGAVAAWDPTRRPLVVARALPSDPADAVRLGLALPGRGRVGLAVREAALAARRPAPLLEDALAVAPAEWRPLLAGVAADLRRAGVPPRVHGSLAWQHLAAEPSRAFLTPSSDVDLLLAPPGWRELEAALALLGGRRGSPRLDGEVLLPGGRAVSWRELASGAARVLVKRAGGGALVPVAEVRRALDPAAP